MKRFFLLALCLVLILSLAGCVNGEAGTVIQKSADAMSQYSSVDYTYHCDVNVIAEYDTYYKTYSQKEDGVYKQLMGSGDRRGSITFVQNKGEPLQAAYYQRGDYGYYDIEGGLRYKQKSRQTNTWNILDRLTLQPSNFKTLEITSLEGGGKQLYFKLDPAAVPPEIANDYILSETSFLPDDFGIVGASFTNFEYTLTMDQNDLKKKEVIKAHILLRLEDGNTARFTYRSMYDYKDYFERENDHIIFPKDLGEYPDLV